MIWLLLGIAAIASAQETLESLVIGTNILKNVRIIQASPVDLLLGHDDGFKRIKLQELPEPLKTKHPYDAAKAEAYQKQQAQEARARAAQNATSVRSSFLVREEKIRANLAELDKELKRLNADIGVQDRRAKGKGPRSRERKQADELRRKKMEVRDQIWRLTDELERTQTLRRKFE